MNSSDKVALVAPATLPQVALLAPTGLGETVDRVTDGVVTSGTNGAAYTPYCGAQLLAVPPMTAVCATANAESKRSTHRTESLRIKSSTSWLNQIRGAAWDTFWGDPRNLKLK